MATSRAQRIMEARHRRYGYTRLLVTAMGGSTQKRKRCQEPGREDERLSAPKAPRQHDEDEDHEPTSRGPMSSLKSMQSSQDQAMRGISGEVRRIRETYTSAMERAPCFAWMSRFRARNRRLKDRRPSPEVPLADHPAAGELALRLPAEKGMPMTQP